jgi:hypothetical protein
MNETALAEVDRHAALTQAPEGYMTRSSLIALASTLVLLGCGADTIAPAPSSMLAPRGPANLVSSFNLPIQFPTGLALKDTTLYLSTGFGFRDTYVISRLAQAVTGTIPTGNNPRDVAFDGTNLLFSDLNDTVYTRNVFGTLVGKFGIPFRGGGIATDGDTIWVGDIDVNQMLLTNHTGVQFTTFPTGQRLEAAVFDRSSHTLWVLTPFTDKLYEMSTTGTILRECDTPYNPGPFGLGGIALVADTFYIAFPQGGDPFVGTTILTIDKASLVCTPSLVLNVRILIYHPPVLLIGHGNGPVGLGILSDANFDATTVVASSVRFGHNGTEASPINTQLRDVDHDGRIDMAALFRIQDTGIVCGDVSAVLTGRTTSGQLIRGSTAIQTLCH